MKPDEIYISPVSTKAMLSYTFDIHFPHMAECFSYYISLSRYARRQPD